MHRKFIFPTNPLATVPRWYLTRLFTNLTNLIYYAAGDFTPVCTTELGEAAKRKADFQKRGVKLCGFSCNNASSHKDWIADILHVTGCETFDYPLFCDPHREHATALGILDANNKNAKGLPMTVRSVYILKPDKTIALMMTYPASTGRNFDEIFRVIDSLQLTVTDKVATPVNWKNGEDVIVNFPLSDAQADETFGKAGYRIQDLPSEKGKELPKHYLRWTKDPSK
jgi:alkyl hydroperoxide reductase subunit AhpC